MLEVPLYIKNYIGNQNNNKADCRGCVDSYQKTGKNEKNHISPDSPEIESNEKSKRYKYQSHRQGNDKSRAQYSHCGRYQGYEKGGLPAESLPISQNVG